MQNINLTHLNPFKTAGYDSEDIIPVGGMGAVAAHAGVGKTALMVQLALNAMLRGKKVLHISLNDPVNKVSLWYQELFYNLAGQLRAEEIREIWETILPNRFIMTFKVEVFDVLKFKERLTDLMVQNIFLPDMIIVDGLKFGDSERDTVNHLKSLAKEHSMRIWFTVHVHRSEEQASDAMPPCLLSISDLFDAVFKLQPEGEEISIRSIKEQPTSATDLPLFLDPSTMLIKSKS
jgi:hypothetical protein